MKSLTNQNSFIITERAEFPKRAREDFSKHLKWEVDTYGVKDVITNDANRHRLIIIITS